MSFELFLRKCIFNSAISTHSSDKKIIKNIKLHFFLDAALQKQAYLHAYFQQQ